MKKALDFITASDPGDEISDAWESGKSYLKPQN
jgi:hypothetical protein